MNMKQTIKVAPIEGRYQKWDVRCIKDGQKNFLKNLDNKGAIIINKENEGTFEVLVESQRLMQLSKLLRERDINYEVSQLETLSPARTRRTRHSGIVYPPKNTYCVSRKFDWKNFHPLHHVYEFLDEIEKTYPSTCTVSNVGKTAEGRDIKLLKISNSNVNNTGVWMDATTHAREWITTSAVLFIADYIARHFNELPKSVTNKDWYILPVVNPDGYYYSHTSDRMWRKNRARFGNMVAGVDLNRNFSYNWGVGVADNTNDPYGLNYRGPDPFSEPETCAIKDIILYSGTPFKIFLTFHSCSEVICFPWCHTSEPCPDYVNLLEGGTAMAKAINETTGRMYKVGSFKDTMYYACGTSIDWSYGTAHIPFSYLLELRSKQDRFLLPKEEIFDCCKEALSAVMALIDIVESKKCLNCSVVTKSLR